MTRRKEVESGLRELSETLGPRGSSLVQTLSVMTQVPGLLPKMMMYVAVFWGAWCLLMTTGFLFAPWGGCGSFVVLIAGTLVVMYVAARYWQSRLEAVVGQPEYRLSSQQLRRGESLDVSYRQEVRAPLELRRIDMQLVLREQATYTQGTDRITATHDHVIHQEWRAGRALQPGEWIDERMTCQVPADAMHSFRATNNRLEWLVTVKVTLSVWPHEFSTQQEITVLPEVGGS
jgi:hypothetical protein